MKTTKRPWRVRWQIWLRSVFERWCGVYYEGPVAPPRLQEELQLWCALNGDATREALVGYMGYLLDAAYRDGFVRGYEWLQRCYDRDQPTVALLQEMATEDMSLAQVDPRVRAILEAGNNPDDPLAGVSTTDRERFLAYLQQTQAYRVMGELPEHDLDEL